MWKGSLRIMEGQLVDSGRAVCGCFLVLADLVSGTCGSHTTHTTFTLCPPTPTGEEQVLSWELQRELVIRLALQDRSAKGIQIAASALGSRGPDSMLDRSRHLRVLLAAVVSGSFPVASASLEVRVIESGDSYPHPGNT